MPGMSNFLKLTISLNDFDKRLNRWERLQEGDGEAVFEELIEGNFLLFHQKSL
jgi:hypothetical protein